MTQWLVQEALRMRITRLERSQLERTEEDEQMDMLAARHVELLKLRKGV